MKSRPFWVQVATSAKARQVKSTLIERLAILWGCACTQVWWVQRSLNNRMMYSKFSVTQKIKKRENFAGKIHHNSKWIYGGLGYMIVDILTEPLNKNTNKWKNTSMKTHQAQPSDSLYIRRTWRKNLNFLKAKDINHCFKSTDSKPVFPKHWQWNIILQNEQKYTRPVPIQGAIESQVHKTLCVI
jgi:hypothetical protein